MLSKVNGYTFRGCSSAIFISVAGPRSAVVSASDSRASGAGFDTRSGHILSFLLPLIQDGQLSKYMHEVLVNCLGGLSLPRKSVVRLIDRPDMTIDVYHGHKTTTQPNSFSPLFTIRSSLKDRTSLPGDRSGSTGIFLRQIWGR